MEQKQGVSRFGRSWALSVGMAISPSMSTELRLCTVQKMENGGKAGCEQVWEVMGTKRGDMHGCLARHVGITLPLSGLETEEGKQRTGVSRAGERTVGAAVVIPEMVIRSGASCEHASWHASSASGSAPIFNWHPNKKKKAVILHASAQVYLENVT
eukprot:1158495-Pelagomonas_calceolata.AAC.7